MSMRLSKLPLFFLAYSRPGPQRRGGGSPIDVRADRRASRCDVEAVSLGRYTAAASGYVNVAKGGEKMTKLTATARALISAGRPTVWSVITDSDLMSKAFFGAKVDTDWRVGSPITYRGEWEGKSFEDKGEILEMRPNQMLRFTHFSPLSGVPDAPENYHTVTFELADKGEATELVITQTNASSPEEQEHSEANWNRVAESVKEIAEG
jgi:uncharacterized protein YndB with AHSA1/START domain